MLAFVGELLRATTRRGADLATRLGGDEFVLALPGTNTSEARDVARRLVTLFAQRVKTMTGLEAPPALSAGIASLANSSAATWEDLLRIADETMYWAKRQHCGVAAAEDVRSQN